MLKKIINFSNKNFGNMLIVFTIIYFIITIITTTLLLICFPTKQSNNQNQCKIIINANYTNDNYIRTSCGHIISDVCPFCEKKVEFIIYNKEETK